MLIRLLPGVAVAVLLAFCCRAEDLSERVLFSAKHAGAAALDRRDLLPDISELGFDEEDTSPEVAEVSAAPKAPQASEAPAAGTTGSSRPRGSESAYASMAQAEDSGGGIPSGDLPPLPLEAAATGGAAYLSMPPRRGLRARAGGEALRARQDPSLLDSTAYSLTGTKYSVGLDCDWSVDTTVGLSLDLLDATVKSGLPYDKRSADIRGVFAGASVDTVLFDSYLVGLKGFYGRLDSRGEGSIASPDDGGATSSLWRAPKHGSGMYGFSASVSVPVLFGDYRVVFDSGVSYRRIDTGSYSYRVDASGPRESPGKGFSSDSLALPAGVSVERDFVTPRALFTPRFGAGSSYEFSGSANGLRSLHALSAMPVHLLAGGFHRAPQGFSSTVRLVHRVNLGLDIATAGGWDMRVDYRRDFASAYRRDSFSAELGRSF